MTEDLKKEFWKRLESIRTGMLEVDGRFLPMSHNLIEGDPNLWFITAKDTPMAQAAEQGARARYLICSDGKGVYADIEGVLAVSSDMQKLDEIWNIVASSWFEEGKRDPDLLLVSYAPGKAETWMSEAGALGFLYQVAKSKISGEKPDMGAHTTLDLG
ncbi:pyridoxamine 5'-phosphate oxidase family protein [Paracoccus aerodenitrificans]|uniref:pyridoxamine 5'-phosphate oxidase family protein n=1 Tax=Paracoccus aerodenitrificans TaxID=3017781 RepID=UPI0022F0EC37|nr:pyridoxamine 5'-phosphate oxidase family protein [Paracoccus aerodenitrificans]WBU64972.1 pyridoxamine 5'-phosphate oxidase family protein [Paracoccus aerodenitrificans]